MVCSERKLHQFFEVQNGFSNTLPVNVPKRDDMIMRMIQEANVLCAAHEDRLRVSEFFAQRSNQFTRANHRQTPNAERMLSGDSSKIITNQITMNN